MIRNALLCMLLLAPCVTSLQANENTNYSVAVELARAKKIDLLVEKINELNNAFKLYVYNTGDTNADITKINIWSGNLNDVSWQNYDKDQLTLIHNEKSSTFGNLFTQEPSKEVLSFLLNSNSISPLSSVDKVSFSLTIPHDNKFMSFYKYTKDLEETSTVEISDTPPTDKSKIWYKPDGRGGYEILSWSDKEGKWVSYGKIGFDVNGSEASNNNIVVKSIDELNTIPSTSGLRAYVSEGGKATEYIYDGEKWVKATNESSGGLFNGDSSILELATSLISKAGGSIASVSDAYLSGHKNIFTGVIELTKKDNSTTNGYWTDKDGKYVIGSTMADINTHGWPDGTTAYLPKSNKTSVDVLRKINGQWFFIADGYTDIARNMNEAKAYSVWNKKDGEYFRYSALDYWYSTNTSGTRDNQTELTGSSNGRAVFSPSPLTKKYLSVVNDCTVDNCNGTDSTNYYAGNTIDGMYAYYYAATSPKNKNSLTDAIPVASVVEAYSKEGSAHILTSNSGEILNGSVLLKYPTNVNGEICYTFDDKFVTSNGIVVQEHLGNKILNKTCGGTTYPTFTGNGTSEQAIIVDSLNDFVGADVPVGYKINIPNKEGIDGTITYCKDSGFTSGSTGEQVWSDACSNLSGAKYAITNGSREDLSSPSNSNRINLTLDVGLKLQEDRYTTDGVQYLSNSNFKQWFYSLTGTNVNLMLDAIIPTATYAYSNGNGTFGYTAGNTKNAYRDTTAKNVGYAYLNSIVAKYDGTYWRKLGSTGKVLSGDFAQEINDNIIAGVAGNGLLYTKDNVAPFTNSNSQTLQGHFGVTTWSVEAMNYVNPRGNTTNICESIGMLLPILSETNATNNPWGGVTYIPTGGSMGTADGVPNHSSGWTWTSTSWTYSTSYYWRWNASGGSVYSYDYNNYVRCVR